RRLARQLELFDILRVDHFIGLHACWSHPRHSSPAEGEWIPAPGDELLTTMFDRLGPVPLVAENLGHTTPGMRALQAAHSLPGMCVLQFGFDGLPDNPNHPARHEQHCVVYTGTHDNDTIVGWWRRLSEEQKALVNQSLADTFSASGEPLHWRMVRLCLDSPAELAVLPMQDLLGLGSEARLNRPGTETGNWSWRLQGDEDLLQVARKVRALVDAAERDSIIRMAN
ncbi:MAG: 4-alpha-glucanotransferase, partial [Pseudomonadota bacterium]